MVSQNLHLYSVTVVSDSFSVLRGRPILFLFGVGSPESAFTLEDVDGTQLGFVLGDFSFFTGLLLGRERFLEPSETGSSFGGLEVCEVEHPGLITTSSAATELLMVLSVGSSFSVLGTGEDGSELVMSIITTSPSSSDPPWTSFSV